MKSNAFSLSLLCVLFVAACNLRSGKENLYDEVPSGVTDYLVPVWNCVEIPFVAGKTYENPLAGEERCEMDVLFTHKDGTVIVRPAFWDGGDCFKVRFAPTLTGIWDYKTICREDPRLDGLGGTVGSNPYTGDLAVYQHG
ncbi:MAG: DUF5060 domain-containing protein, partial [Tannerellaceae bacterium]|nr:DUF5060 domain-containing protein [Tannerellaceae bacterium]